MHRKRKPDHHCEPSSPTAGRSSSSSTHPLPRSTKMKTEHGSTPTTSLMKPDQMHSSNVARSSHIDESHTTKRPTLKSSSLSSLRSTPAFSNMTHSCSVHPAVKPQRTPHSGTAVDGQIIDLISPPHSDTRSQKETSGHRSKRFGKIGTRRSPDRLPWRNGDPTCSPPRTITFGPPLPSSYSDSTNHLTYHSDQIELYHRIATQLESLDSRLDKMEKTLTKLQRTQKFILNDAKATPLRQEQPNYSQQLQQMSNLLLKLYAATNRIESRSDMAAPPPSHRRPQAPPK